MSSNLGTAKSKAKKHSRAALMIFAILVVSVSMTVMSVCGTERRNAGMRAPEMYKAITFRSDFV